jgi:hypothetical protein
MKSETTARLDRGKVYVVYSDGIGGNASTKGAYKRARLGFRTKELLGGLDWRRRDGHPVAAPDESGMLCLQPPNIRQQPMSQLEDGERQLSALCSRWLTTRRMGEDAPFRSFARATCPRWQACPNRRGWQFALEHCVSQQPVHRIEAAIPSTLMRLPKRRISETVLSQYHARAGSIRMERNDRPRVAGTAIGKVRTPSPTEG